MLANAYILLDSLSPWERVGVRGFAAQQNAERTITLALSLRERALTRRLP
jgi:hypothetical protein